MIEMRDGFPAAVLAVRETVAVFGERDLERLGKVDRGKANPSATGFLRQ